MAHPGVLVEMDLEKDTRWITVNGSHIPFCDATQPLEDEGPEFPGEDAAPDTPHWRDFLEDPKGYAEFKRRQAEWQSSPVIPK